MKEDSATVDDFSGVEVEAKEEYHSSHDTTRLPTSLAFSAASFSFSNATLYIDYTCAQEGIPPPRRK
jgi:hypothetical protein